jgi:hypothetical protein
MTDSPPRAIKPGGWFEPQDVGGLVSDEQDISQTRIDQWYRTALKVFRVTGREVQVPQLYAHMLKDAGSEDFHEELFKWLLNKWPRDKHMKKLGIWSTENIFDSIEVWSIMPFTQFLGLSVQGHMYRRSGQERA